MIDPRAVIDPSAKIASDVEIGPYTVVGPNVEIGAGTWIGASAVILKNTKLGKYNKIYQFASIGTDPQDFSFTDTEEGWLLIGDHNVFHPCVTINRGTAKQDLETCIGNHNMFMAYAHVAHDCIIGDHALLMNSATLAGHIFVDNYAVVGAFCAIHQFCNVGRHCYISRGAMVVKDILPFLLVSGNEPKTYGLNTVGLERRGFNKETIKTLSEAYKLIFRKSLNTTEAIEELKKLLESCTEVEYFIEGLQRSQRGIVR